VDFLVPGFVATSVLFSGMGASSGVADDVTLGLFAANPQTVQSVAFLVFPLTFVSSAYSPVSTMPGWLQVVANHQLAVLRLRRSPRHVGPGHPR
jgi:hypothetical protein